MSGRMSHNHVYGSLWSHWGQYGEQNEHVHWCDCGESVVVGSGRDCTPNEPHEQRRWSDRATKWIKVKAFHIGAVAA